MKNFNQIINEETLDWLLEKDNPSVLYFTLIKILNKSKNDVEVIAAKESIMKTGIVPQILSKQNMDGCWGDSQRFYTDKYRGTVWQLMLLAELGADAENMQIKKAGEFILNNAQEAENYGFSPYKSGKSSGGRAGDVIPCLTGNIIWSLITLGFADDERVKKGIEWICKYQRCDDGVHEKPVGTPYDRYPTCWGRHTCHMGVVKSLKALSALPKEKRDEKTERKINELAEYLLIHHIYKKSHDLSKVSKPGWLKLGFPLMYQTDVLEILGILTDIGCHDPRMDDTLKILENKQHNEKRWLLENSFNGKMLVTIEKKGSPSKWITLKALTVLMNSV